MWTTYFYKIFFKNILFYMNGRSSKIRSVHTHVITRTVYFDCSCISWNSYKFKPFFMHSCLNITNWKVWKATFSTTSILSDCWPIFVCHAECVTSSKIESRVIKIFWAVLIHYSNEGILDFRLEYQYWLNGPNAKHEDCKGNVGTRGAIWPKPREPNIQCARVRPAVKTLL